jgi:hypothetical protein
MRIAYLLPVLLSVGSVELVQSALRLSKARTHDPTLDEIGTEIEDAGKAIKKKAEDTFRSLQHGPAQDGNAKKPLMDSIEVMRATMCWYRSDLIEHEKCMDWLVEHCEKEVSGQGICKKMPDYVKHKCREGHPMAKHYANKMGISSCEKDSVGEVADTQGEDAEAEKDTKQEEQGKEPPVKVRYDPKDQDHDGVENERDAFPNNPLEWKDTDHDGMGDNGDEFPKDSTRAHEGEAKVASAPSAAPAAAPVPDGLSMSENTKLPVQGYNEHSVKYVAHDDGVTMTRDWRREWPMGEGNEETSVRDICAQNPKLAWCKLKRSKSARKAYANSHP